MSKKNTKMGHPIPLKIPRDMEARLKTLSAQTNLSMADLMRLAIERGFGTVEKMFEKPAEQAA